MPVLRRRLLNFVTFVSLMLCAASFGLWVRGHGQVDQLTYTGELTRYILTTADGGFDLQVDGDYLFAPADQGWRRRRASEPGSRSQWRLSVRSPQNPFTQGPRREPVLGFWWGQFAPPQSSAIVMGPVWPLGLPFAILPAFWAARRARRAARDRRRGRGLCPACGYDLTGNVSGVCPECGSRAGGAS